MLTVDDLATALPAHLKSAATSSLVQKVNGASSDPEIAGYIRENFVTYTGVLREGNHTAEQYLNAVTYVSLKLMGHSNQEAWSMTFPLKHQRLVSEGRTAKEISSYVAGYNKGKLVNAILEQTLVPTWVLNQDIYQKAINTNAMIMMDEDVSAKVRVEAATSILTHLKKPETKQVELNLGVQESTGLTELKDMLSNLAQQQQDLIGQGISTKTIAHQDIFKKQPDIIDVTPEPVTPDPSTQTP